MVTDDSHAQPLLELSACRAAIEALDTQLVAMLAERLTLSRRTATLKHAAGLPLLDPGREAEVIRRVSESARQHDLPPDAIREIWWRVIGLCRGAQQDAT